MNIKGKFLDVFLWLWMFPQQLIGFCICTLLKSRKKQVYLKFQLGNCIHTDVIIHEVPKLFHSAVSLGTFLIFDSRTDFSMDSIRHEIGHTKQSLYLGWLYLLVVGIPSLLGNIYSRIFKKSSEWYYSRFPESWADKLGGVKRWK